MTVDVWENRAAGEVHVGDHPPGFHWDYLGEFNSEDDAEMYIQSLIAQTTVWAVFWDNGRWEGYVSQEHCYSGNYRGSGHYPYTYMGEYETRSEAEAALQRLAS